MMYRTWIGNAGKENSGDFSSLPQKLNWNAYALIQEFEYVWMILSVVKAAMA